MLDLDIAVVLPSDRLIPLLDIAHKSQRPHMMDPFLGPLIPTTGDYLFTRTLAKAKTEGLIERWRTTRL